MDTSRMILVAVVLLATISCAFAAQGAKMTIDELWRDFDPEALPLDIQLLDQWEQDGVMLKSVFFTSEVVDGVPVRVYAIYGYPSGQTHLPAVLHIHGGGQTAALDHVLFWAKRGYAAATFDHTGPWENRTIYTHWGKLDPRPLYQTDVMAHPKTEQFYHGTIAARRVITFLTSQPEVDKSRIGIYGISYGGTYTWLVAGTDKRVKCAVPIYGCGGLHERMNPKGLADWATIYDDFAYAPRQVCPVLFLGASNDFHGWIEHADKILGMVPQPNWHVFSHGDNHHIAPEPARDLPMWMDTWLRDGPAWPKPPTLSIMLDANGVPTAQVTVGPRQEITEVYVRYNIESGADPPARFWRTSQALSNAEGKWIAQMPVSDTKPLVRAYCDVHYRSGLVLSSRLAQASPEKLGIARATTKPTSVIDDFIGGRICDWVYDAAYTDPILTVGSDLIPIVDGPDGGWGLMANPKVFPDSYRIATAKIGDPAYQGRKHTTIIFQARYEPGSKLNIVLTRDQWKPTLIEYRAEVTLPDDKSWCTIKIKRDDFKDKDGKPLDSCDSLNQLRFEAQYPNGKPIAIAMVHWSD